MSDIEWAFFAPFLIKTVRVVAVCRRITARFWTVYIFWITRTGSPWRDLPDEFGNWNSVHRRYRL